MNADQKIKMMIGEYVINNISMATRLEELEKALQEKNEKIADLEKTNKKK